MVDKMILTERSLLVLLSLFRCVLCADGDQTLRLQQVKASDLTLPGVTEIQPGAQILWFYGPEKEENIVYSLDFEGKTVTKISERFKERVQLNRSSGALTIRNISTSDSGFYTLQVIAGGTITRTFNITVYAPVSVPVINQEERSSSFLNESCILVCTVQNGKDVNLTWYNQKEMISSSSLTNGTHLSVSLYLPPEIQPSSSSSRYICVSANPVSNQTASLHITELCYQQPEKSPEYRHMVIIPALVSAAFLLLIILLSGLLIWRKKQEVSLDPVTVSELDYADVKIKTPNGRRVDEDEPLITNVEYSSVDCSEVKRFR